MRYLTPLLLTLITMLAAGCGASIKDRGGAGPVDPGLYASAVELNQQRIAGEDHPLHPMAVMHPQEAVEEGYDKMIGHPLTHLWEVMWGDTPAKAVRQMLDADNPDNRWKGTLRLAEFAFARKGDDAMKVYAKFPRDPHEDWIVQAAGIRALNRSRATGYTALFVKALNDVDQKDLPRLEAAKALANIPDELAISALAQHAREDKSLDVRIACIDALRNFRTTEVLRTLVNVLNEKDFSVVWQARQSLAMITGQDFRYNSRAWLDYVAAMK